jgi:hypothetical protein
MDPFESGKGIQGSPPIQILEETLKREKPEIRIT